MPLWISVGGSNAADYARICERIGERDSVDVLELNLSCPNVDPAAAGAAEIVRPAAPSAASRCTPSSRRNCRHCRSRDGVIEAGASGLSLVNSLRGLVLDEWTLEPRLARAVGDIPVRRSDRSLWRPSSAVTRRRREPSRSSAWAGASGKHALDLIAAGASAVALGSVLFGDLEAPERVRSELEEEARARGFERPSEARGAAHQPFAA